MIRVRRYHTRREGVNNLRRIRIPLLSGYQAVEGSSAPLPISQFTFDPADLDLFGSVRLVATLVTTDAAYAATVQLINRGGVPTDVTSGVVSTTSLVPVQVQATLTLGVGSDEFNLTATEYDVELQTPGGSGVIVTAGDVYLVVDP